MERWLVLAIGVLVVISLIGYRIVFGEPDEEIVTRMTAEEARLAAVATMEYAPFHGAAGAEAVKRDGKVIWLVRSSTTGSGWTAEVEDATGECLGVKRWGVR